MMKIGLPLEVFYYTDHIKELEVAGVPYKLKECEVRVVVFYHIDTIGMFLDSTDNNKEYTEMWVSGTRFLLPEPPSQTKIRLEQHLRNLSVDFFNN